MRPSIVLGTLFLVAILGFGSIEFVQRTRFERQRKEIEAAVWSLDGVKLQRTSVGIGFLPVGAVPAEACFQVGSGYNMEDKNRWIMWSLSPKSLTPEKLADIWTEATVIVMLRQERAVFLRSPRVTISKLRPPHPEISARMDTLFKSRGIEYEPVDALP
jgi:hypothetical protein